MSKLKPFPYKARPNAPVGSRYVVVSSNNPKPFRQGAVVVLTTNDKTVCPFFKEYNTETGKVGKDSSCLYWNELAPYEAYQEHGRFKDEPRPFEKEGTKFILSESIHGIPVGTVVTLAENDGTNMPWFTTATSTVRLALSWKRLKPIQKVTPAQQATPKSQPTEPTTPLTAQVGGDHYKKFGDYQPWQVLAKWLSKDELKGFMKGTVISYLAREEDKGGRLDIEKAKHTLELYLELTKEK